MRESPRDRPRNVTYIDASLARRMLALTGMKAASSMFVIAALLAISPSSAADRRDGDPQQPSLTARDVHHYFQPYVPAVRDCYAANANRHADGRLELHLVIEPSGDVGQFDFAAGGVTGEAYHRLGTCLRELVPSWHFPVRRGPTNAAIPLWFQRIRD